MKRLITTQDATGNVVAEWSGGEDQTLAPRAGHTHRDVTGTTQSYGGQRWNGNAFEPLPPSRNRLLSRIDFARLFTQAEDIAIDNAAVSDTAVKYLQRRFGMAGTVNLDHADVAAGLSLLVQRGLLTAARKTAILAGPL